MPGLLQVIVLSSTISRATLFSAAPQMSCVHNIVTFAQYFMIIKRDSINTYYGTAISAALCGCSFGVILAEMQANAIIRGTKNMASN